MRERTRTTAEYVSALSRITLEDNGSLSPFTLGKIVSSITAIIAKLAGFISFGGGRDGEWAGHIDGQWRMGVDTPDTANTQFFVEHGLGRIPVHFEATADRACSIYADEDDRASWSTTRIYLKCNVLSAKIYLLIV